MLFSNVLHHPGSMELILQEPMCCAQMLHQCANALIQLALDDCRQLLPPHVKDAKKP